ncbi:MAG: DNA polymerase-4 [Candidatus Poriferisodalaceae bacterium]|jgi:DNA polymerase-4
MEPFVDVPTASILHADLDAFYASVEQRDAPELRGKPVIVGGGVVLAASYEAKARGVRTAMNSRQARDACPDAIVVPPRMEAYTQASKDVFAIFDDVSPVVEPISIDEAFIDVSGLLRLSGEPARIAADLRQRVKDDVGLAITVGVARTKFLAKVASGVGKPDGLLVVEPHLELEFLHPLPVQRLWGVGPITADKLAAKGIHTVGDVARLHASTLVAILGPGAGRHIHALAHNRDPRPVEVRRRRRSVGSQQALGRGKRTRTEIESILLGLVDRVCRRLRAGDRVARTVTLRFRYDDFGRATRSHTLVEAAHTDAEILVVARDLLDRHWQTIEDRGITLIGLALGHLNNSDAVQLALHFADDDGRTRDRTVRDQVLDDVRDKFGGGLLKPASLLGQSHISVPMMPDPGEPRAS